MTQVAFSFVLLAGAGTLLASLIALQTANTRHDPRFAQEAPTLYADISSAEKLLVEVQCATHFLLFERNHEVVHRVFAEFLTRGTVNGRQGLMTLDRKGKYVQ